LGVETIFEIGADGTQLVIFGDGDVEPAFGIQGGKDGSLNSIKLRYPDGREHLPLSLDLITDVPKGTVYHQEAGGGGGYGDPKQRLAELIATDVRNGVVSPNVARDIYGVAVDEKTFAIDTQATDALRKGASSGRE
jgi:N-methylhydantoinase B